jgi:hypothetical protein
MNLSFKLGLKDPLQVSLEGYRLNHFVGGEWEEHGNAHSGEKRSKKVFIRDPNCLYLKVF